MTPVLASMAKSVDCRPEAVISSYDTGKPW